MATYAYDAWGNMTYCNAGTEVAYINPFLYRGYYYDSESGLYYLMTRYYDTQIGQFISMDTPDYLAPDTVGGVDLYAYGLNNPVMFVDSTGHFVISLGLALLIGFVVGAAVGFGATVYTDYKDDGEVFNGSVSAGEYIGNTLIGGAIGTAAAGLIYAAPSIGASIGAAFNTGSFATATSGAVAVGIEQAVALATVGVIGVGAILYYSNGRDPIAPRINSPTRKEAYDKAFQKGGKKPPRGPENHGFGWHFHPNVPKGSPYTHWHYFFKKPHILIYLFLGLFSDEEE